MSSLYFVVLGSNIKHICSSSNSLHFTWTLSNNNKRSRGSCSQMLYKIVQLHDGSGTQVKSVNLGNKECVIKGLLQHTLYKFSFEQYMNDNVNKIVGSYKEVEARTHEAGL